MGSIVKNNNNNELLMALKDLGVELEEGDLLTSCDLVALNELPELLKMMAFDQSLDDELRENVSKVIKLCGEDEFA